MSNKVFDEGEPQGMDPARELFLRSSRVRRSISWPSCWRGNGSREGVVPGGPAGIAVSVGLVEREWLL